MPRLARTILPRIKKSLHTRGFVATIWRCVFGPYTLLQRHLKNRKQYVADEEPNQFDLQYGVETTKRVHLSDLEIDSPNWIYADGYWPTPPHVFEDALSGLATNFENLVFIDFGSGKGRVLLMASEFPFRKIIGVEFAGELHAIAEENVRRYKSSAQKCQEVSSVCADFTQFPIPAEPLFAFLYNPSSMEITFALARNLADSLRDHPREMWVLYVTPFYDVFEPGGPLPLRKIKSNAKYALYTNLTEWVDS